MTTNVSDVLNKEASNYSTTTSSTKTDLGKDDFLKLLLNQMSNQDPLNPVTNQDFVAQLAQFSSLEQLTNVNTQLTTMTTNQTSQSSANAVTFIGKNVEAMGDWMSYDGSGSGAVNYTLAGAADNVTITIKDSSGSIVRTQTLSNVSKGDHTWTWDGKDKNNSPMKAGTYTMSVSAEDSSGTAVSSYTTVTGRIDGINYESGYPKLMIGDQEITLSDIIKVTEE